MFFNNKFNTFFGLNLTLVYTFPMCMTWRFHFPLRNYDFKFMIGMLLANCPLPYVYTDYFPLLFCCNSKYTAKSIDNFVYILGPCRVPGYPTDESSTRFRFAGSITRIGNFTLINCILINDDAINKTDRKTYHWKRQNIPFATRYPLN